MILRFMKGFSWLKSIIYFFWGIVKKIAYYINFFDHKPSHKQVIFKENIRESNIDINNIAIVVHTCDTYEFLWKGFIYFFEKFWGDCSIKKYFLSEDKITSFVGRKSILSGKGERNQRLITGLEQIPEDYIIYIQEDFRFLRLVPNDIIIELVEFCIQYDIKLLKLHDQGDEYLIEQTDKIIAGKNVNIVNKNSEYLMSHAISIRNKQFFIEHLNKSGQESPWENEIKGTFRMKFNKKIVNIYQYNMFSKEFKYDDIGLSSYRGVCARGEYNSHIKEYINFLL